MVGEFLAYNGRWPHFLARANLFYLRCSGAAASVPSRSRFTAAARTPGTPCSRPKRALSAGEVIVIYPEGTITFDSVTNGRWPPTPARPGSRWPPVHP